MPSWETMAIVQKINHKAPKDSNGIQDQVQENWEKRFSLSYH